MYDFEPTEEQQMLIDWVRKFATSDLRPAAHDFEENALVPASLIDKGWEMGILQASIPEIYGGFGDHSAITGVLALEEMAWGDVAGSLSVMSPGLFAIPILLCGSEHQKQSYLPQIVEAGWRPFSAAMIEPNFDFDPLSLKSKAEKIDDAYQITGEKIYVPYAESAEYLIVYADLDGETQGFIVPRDAEGLKIGDRSRMLGVNGYPTYAVSLSQVSVPLDNRLGAEEGHDFTPILTASRLALAALGVGLARAALEYSLEYAKDREVFGVKVAQKQSIAFMLAEMATEIEAMRLLTWEAAWMSDEGMPEARIQAYLAATGSAEMAMAVTDSAVQILGGHGYIREHPVEHWMRNGRGIALLLGLVIV